MLGLKKGNTKELCGRMPLHYPADRTYLLGNTNKDTESALIFLGTKRFENPIYSIGSSYYLCVSLPTNVLVYNSITCSLFRPGGQTIIKDENPTVTVSNNTNQVIISTSNSNFASYVGKGGIVELTFT